MEHNKAINAQDRIKARITAVHRDRFDILWDENRGHARVRQAAYRDEPALSYPTVGDEVVIMENPAGDAMILSTLPRKSFFRRKMPGNTYEEQAVAANFDLVLILSSMNQEFNARRVERYVALAYESGGLPILVLTKRDLAEDVPTLLLAAEQAAPGTEVLALSAHTGEGMEALAKRLTPGVVAVLLGSSGVGKSSLVNALCGDATMAVGDIRSDDDRGRHTTTHRQMVMLPSGAALIDTPGMRELGLWDASEGLADAFLDIEAHAKGCRFRNCAHQAEPGCAVKEAIQGGLLSEKRLKSYLRLHREAKRRKGGR